MNTDAYSAPEICPCCKSIHIVFKQKVGVWECQDCEQRFSTTLAEPPVRRLGDKAPQPKHIFFSYGHDTNRDLIERFKADLEKRGHQVWFDAKDIGVWDDWKGAITRGIDRSQMAIAFMSKHALRDPGVCRNEIAIALNRFGTIYPVAVEADIYDSIPRTIRFLQWPDLSQWQAIKDGQVPGEDWDRWYEARLVELIEKVEGEASHFAGESNALREVLRPSGFDSKFAQHVPGFIGREWVFDAYQNWLDHEPESRLFWIKAGPGVGKTALAVNLADRERGAIVASWFCDAKSPELKNPNQAIRTLAYQWALRWEDYRVRLLRALGITALTPEDKLDEVRKELNQKATQDLFKMLLVEPLANLIWREHKLVVVVDALDEATDEDGNNPLTEFIANQMASLPEWISFVVTSRPDPAVMARLGGFKPYEIDAQDTRNLADLRLWYRDNLGQRPELAVLPTDEQLRIEDLLIDRSEGMILYLKLVEEGLREGSLTVEGLDALEAGLPGLFRRYYESFNQRFGKDYESTVKPLIRLLAAAGGPLPEDLARAVLEWNSEQFNTARVRLGSFVVESTEGLELFHKTLGEWLDDRASGPFHVDKAVGRQQIANSLFQEIANSERHAIRWRTPIREWLPAWLPQLDQHDDAPSIGMLGGAFRGWADYIQARPLLEMALVLREKTLGLEHPSTATSLNNLALLLEDQGNYAEAEPFLRRALDISEKTCGPVHPDTATSLNNLATLLENQGNYAEAEPFLRRALDINEKTLGPAHPNTLASLSNLATLLNSLGNYAEAEPLYRRALAIREKALGPVHPDTASSLNNLAELLRIQGNYTEAEPLYRRALDINEKTLGPAHPNTLASLNNLATLLNSLGNYAEAEPLYRRALAIREKALGPVHPDTASSLNNLATLLHSLGNYTEAEPLSRRALAIREKALRPEHPDTALSLNNLAVLLKAQGNYAEAEPFYRRALAIREKALGPEHPDTASSLNNLATLLDEQGDSTGAEPFYRRALAIREKTLGPEHPSTVSILNNLAGLLKDQGNYAEAESLYRRALAIREKTLGPEHPSTASILNNLAVLLKAQGNYAEAEPFYRRALTIREKVLDATHPDTVTSLNNLALMMYTQGKYAEAVPLFRRSLAIQEKTLDPKHPDIGAILNILAVMLCSLGNLTEAEPLFHRALVISEKAMGAEHPDTATIRMSLSSLIEALNKADEAPGGI